MTAPPAGLSAASVVVASEDQVSTELDGQAVILNLADGVYYGLDPIGARVWAMITEPRPVSELRDAIVQAYEVDADTALSDLLDLLGDLAERGLVEVRPA